jgi:hypothetical protein
MKKVQKLFFALGLCSLMLNNVAQAADHQMLIYKNQRGSNLALIFNPTEGNTGTLTGTFTTAVGNCAQDIGVPLPILGYYNGSALTVTVNFPHCQQVIAMTGNMSAQKDRIRMLWLDTSQVKNPDGINWSSNVIGADSYKKIN